jgi:hypothetical protein
LTPCATLLWGVALCLCVCVWCPPAESLIPATPSAPPTTLLPLLLGRRNRKCLTYQNVMDFCVRK